MTRTPPLNPPTLALHYSMPRVLFVLALVLAFTVSLGYYLFAIAGLFGARMPLYIPGALTAGFAFFVVLAFALEPLRALRHRGPVVTLDEHGITDERRVNSFIAWLDVSSITLGFVQPTRRWLVLQLHERASHRLRSGRLAGVRRFLRRAVLLGDWHASLSLLACRQKDVLDAAEALRQAARRRDAAERAARG